MKAPYPLFLSARNNLSTKRILQLMLMMGALTGFAQGQVLLEDNFSGTGNLNGQHPDTVDTGGTTWNVTDGTNTLGSGVDSFSGFTRGTYNSLLYSGSNFVNGKTYDLSAKFTTDGGGWIAIGFGYNPGGGGDLFNPSTSATMLLNNGAGSWVAWYTDGGNVAIGAPNGTGLASGTMEIQLTLDNTGAGSLSYFIGPNANSLTEVNPGAPLSLTAAEVDAITSVGFEGNGAVTGTFDSFELSAIPEPGTYAMVTLGLGALVIGVRLRRMSSRV